MPETEGAKSRFSRGAAFASELADYAKLVALVLAILGFAGAYFPEFRRSWETFAEPSAWFEIGQDVNGDFVATGMYDSPLWTHGSQLKTSDLGKLAGSIVRTDGDGAHIGRKDPETDTALLADLPKERCLYVVRTKAGGLATVSKAPNGPKAPTIWALAKKVTCD